MGDDGGHLAQSRKGRLFAQLALDLGPHAEIVQHAGELPDAADRHLADREMKREHASVPSPTLDLTPEADDAWLARR